MKQKLYWIVPATLLLLGSLMLAQMPQGPRGNLPQGPECGPGHPPNGIHAHAGPFQALLIIGRYLELDEDQVEDIRYLLGEAREVSEEIRAELIPLREALRQELNSQNPAPSTVGALTIDIHELRSSLREIQLSTRQDVLSLLTEEQRGKVEAVFEAARLQPVVNAFKALKLLPPPPPPSERGAVE